MLATGGSAIDAIHAPDILGCVAGDDTVIIVVSSEQAAKDISENANTEEFPEDDVVEVDLTEEDRANIDEMQQTMFEERNNA